MSLIQGLKTKLGMPGKRVYDTTTPPPSSFGNMSMREKLQSLVISRRTQNRQQKLRRNTTWYMSVLAYQGYQNLELNAAGSSLDVYDRDDFYIENQYRRHVDIVVEMLNKMEGDILVRPASDRPQDIAKARVSDDVLALMRDTIGYERIKHLKNLYKALMGNAFIFADYVVDKKYGSIVTPKFSYEERPDPTASPALPSGDSVGASGDGGAVPNAPNAPPQDPSTVMTKVVTGYDKRNKGQEIATVCSPLEINCFFDVKGGIEALPWIQWYSRQDLETLNYLYPGLNATSSSSVEADLATQYLEVLGNLPGNILGDSLAFNRGAEQTKAELLRTWLQPCTFRDDQDLLREFPDGVHVTTINGTVVDFYAENLCDRWTHEVLIPVPHSMSGDGLYDAMLMQDQLNEMNSLIIQHERYATVGHNVYDATVIDSKDWVNDPKNGLIPGRPAMDKTIRDAVFQLQPQQLSPWVSEWRSSLLASMQDMTGAYDPVGGKSMGANTPYSQSVFLAERAQSRWQGSLQFNRPELIRFHRQLLDIAQKNWVDTRTRSVMDNTGEWSFQQFSQADLAGDVDIILTNTDFKPRSRAEQIQGLTMLTTLAPLLPMMPPRQKLRIEEMLGLPPDANPMNSQISRAYRQIDRITKGDVVTPSPMLDDATAQAPVLQDFLISEDGESLAERDPQAWANVHGYWMTLMQMHMMQMAGPAGQMAQSITSSKPQGPQQPNQGSAPKQAGTPGGQVGQPGGGNPNQGGNAQSPAAAPPISPAAAGSPQQTPQ